MSTANAQFNQDDEQIRVTHWSFGADGDDTGHHVHEYDYLVVPITGGTFLVQAADGSDKSMVQHPGSSYPGIAGAAHNVINRSGRPTSFVEIEFKK